MPEPLQTTRDIGDLLVGRKPGCPPIAILPVGCTEQHGPHLPLDTDTLIAAGMSRTVALRFHEAGHPVHVFPAVAFSPTRSNSSFPGTVSADEGAFRTYVSSLVDSLLVSDFAVVVLLSAHGPADPSLREISFVAVDRQFRRGTKPVKPVLPVSLAEAGMVLTDHFGLQPGRHADWREFLLLYHLLGPAYFTPERIEALRTFQRTNTFGVPSGLAPGIPVEHRSVQGVVGNPLPGDRTDYSTMGESAWATLSDRIIFDLQAAMASLPGESRWGEDAD